MPNKITRRHLLQSAAATMTVPYWMTSGSLKAAALRSNRPNAAVIGCGGRGTSMAWHQFGPRTNVIAICDADLRKAAKSAAVIEAKLGYKPRIYQDYRQLLERKDIDVVGNATPDHWHTRINIDACHAGMDLYAEKPLTFSIDEGKQLRQVVHETGRILQVGSQQRSGRQFRQACELVRNGRIGRLRRVGVLLPFNADAKGGPFSAESVPTELDWDLWQGQAPKRSFCSQRLKFRRWHDYAAGMITDWGHHHFDIAHWGMGMDDSGPLTIDAQGHLYHVGKVDCFNNIDVFSAHLTYPGDIDLWCVTVRDRRYLQSLASGYPTAEADARIYSNVPAEILSENRNGIMFIGDKGSLFVDRDGLRGAAAKELKTNPLPADAERLYVSEDHMGNLIDCVKTRKQPICNVDIGHRSVTACHLVNISMRLKRKIQWDPAKEEIIGDPEANAWLSREQRAPYTLG